MRSIPETTRFFERREIAINRFPDAQHKTVFAIGGPLSSPPRCNPDVPGCGAALLDIGYSRSRKSVVTKRSR